MICPDCGKETEAIDPFRKSFPPWDCASCGRELNYIRGDVYESR